MKRRDFIRILGGSAAGVFLVSCWGSGGGDDYAMPTTYAYRPLFRTGDQLPGPAGAATFLAGAAKINNQNEIIFRATDQPEQAKTDHNVGIYGLDLEWTVDGPVVADARRIVGQGDQASFPGLGIRRAAAMGEVGDLGLADINDQGTVAVKLRPKKGGTETLFANRKRRGFEPVVANMDTTPDGKNRFGAALGNYEIGDNDDLAVTAHYSDQDANQALEGLFHLPGGQVDENGRLLLRSGDMIPETNDMIGNFGLFQFDGPDGDYALQVHTRPVSQNGSNNNGGTALLTGRAAERYAQSLRVRAGSGLSLARGLQQSEKVLAGDVLYGPRLGDGKTATVVHIDDDLVALVFKNRVVAATNGYTPTGHQITGLGGPIVSPNGLVYFVAYTKGDVTEQLIASDGQNSTVMLSAPSPLFGENYPQLVTIGFGLTKKQINREDQMVFVAEFEDNSQAVIMGWPA